MDYFITLNEKSIDAIGEAVEKPITVIDGLKSTIAEQAETIADKDEEIAQKDEEIEGLEGQISQLQDAIAERYPIDIIIQVTNNRAYDVSVPRITLDGDGGSYVLPTATVIKANQSGTFEIAGVFNMKRYPEPTINDFAFINMTTGLAVYNFSTLNVVAAYSNFVKSAVYNKIVLKSAEIIAAKQSRIELRGTLD